MPYDVLAARKLIAKAVHFELLPGGEYVKEMSAMLHDADAEINALRSESRNLRSELSDAERAARQDREQIRSNRGQEMYFTACVDALKKIVSAKTPKAAKAFASAVLAQLPDSASAVISHPPKAQSNQNDSIPAETPVVATSASTFPSLSDLKVGDTRPPPPPNP